MQEVENTSRLRKGWCAAYLEQPTHTTAGPHVTPRRPESAAARRKKSGLLTSRPCTLLQHRPLLHPPAARSHLSRQKCCCRDRGRLFPPPPLPFASHTSVAQLSSLASSSSRYTVWEAPTAGRHFSAESPICTSGRTKIRLGSIILYGWNHTQPLGYRVL